MFDFFEKMKYKKVILLSVLLVPLFALFLLLGVNNNYIKSDNRVTDGYHEVHITMETLSDNTKPQGVIKKYTMNIEDFHTNANCLAFKVVHHYAQVYIDGELVYDFTPSSVKKVGNTLGCSWIIVPIVHDDKDKIIEVELTPVYFDVVEDEIAFYHGSQYDIFIDILLEEIFWMLISIGCLVVGFILLFGHAHAKRHHRAHNESFAYLGAIAILIACWRLFDMDLAPFLFEGYPRLLFYLSYVSLMIAPLPLIRYIECLLSNKKSCLALRFLYAVYFTVIIVALILQLLNLVDIRYNISLLLAIMSVVIISIIIISFIEGGFIVNKKNNSIKQMLPVFLGVLSIGCILDIIIYLSQGTTDNLVFTFISFFLYSLIVAVNSLSENDKKYYKDFQTGLYNSNSCTEFIQENANLKNCAIMMFDLDGLKYTNDNYGHAAGDRLILDLTEVLKKSIPIDDFVGRYGGDEFIAVIKNCNPDKLNKIVHNLERNQNEINMDRLPKLSFAYGWALSNEHDGNLSDLMKIADKNMYDHKNEHYKQLNKNK